MKPETIPLDYVQEAAKYIKCLPHDEALLSRYEEGWEIPVQSADDVRRTLLARMAAQSILEGWGCLDIK